MKIPIVSGIYTDPNATFRTSYPINLIPVPKQTGINEGYLAPSRGIDLFGTGPGTDRGGIVWNGTHYRVMGAKLVSVSGNGIVTTLGDVGSGGQVTLDYSFDRLAISSGGRLYYWNGTLTQVTDPDLGTVLDHCWIDGYFITTDGEFLVQTELNDPTSVDPLKYGSSESDPDPIKGVIKLNNELVAVNRHTVETFSNVGGTGFAFARIDGAVVQKGAVGTYAFCEFMDSIALVGGGRNEAIGVWVASTGGAQKLSTAEIDTILAEFTEAQLSGIVLEKIIDRNHAFLYLHLPDRTLVFDGNASRELQAPCWHILTSSVNGYSAYRARNHIYAGDKWIAGDPTSSNLGQLTLAHSKQYGETVYHEFGCPVLYAEGNDAIIHELELACLPGRTTLSANPSIWARWSEDGETWSQYRIIQGGKQGQRNKRIAWRKLGKVRAYRYHQFRWQSDAHMSVTRLEAALELLNTRPQ